MYDFIAIGDIVTDAFIKLHEARTNCDINRENCTITLAFGDKIPYESVEVIRAVGNSANAAVSAARLGLRSALVTNVGSDHEGNECLEKLKGENVATDFISVHQGKKTNYHYVLRYESDRTILVKHEEYDYHLPEIDTPKWLYFSSLAKNTLKYHRQVAEYLESHPEVLLAFQPGTFQIGFGKEKLKEIYARANILFCNVEEAERILGLDTLGVNELLRRIYVLGPKIVVITDGIKGAYAYDGKNFWFQPLYPDSQTPVDRTGAGDAFASTTVIALILGHHLQTALAWGAINSMSVVQHVGAQKGLLSRSQIEKYLKDAPANFVAKQIN